MTHNNAKTFWTAYITMVNENNSHLNMLNPADDFNVRSRSGEFDNLSDDEYEKIRTDVEDISSFWNHRHSETIGIILLNAIAKTNILDSEIDDIAKILTDASVRTDYCTEESEESQECDEKDLFNPDLDFLPVDGPTPFDRKPESWTPKDIYEYLCQHIYGQEAAKKAVSMLMYNHLHGNSRNMVVAGPSGSGKTEMFRALSKIYDCIRIINGPQLSCDGWKGSLKISDIFMYERKQVAQSILLVIDESDKMMEPQVASGGTDYAKMIQNELLKLMDGDTLTFTDEKNRNNKVTVNCSGVSIVLCGSFERMLQAKSESSESIGFGRQEKTESNIAECTEEDLIQYGNMRREIAGRIGTILTMKKLNADDFEAIMDSPASPIKKIEKSHHVSLSVDKDSRKKLASDAAESGLGCRFIRCKLQSLLDEQMFDKPDEKEYELCYE